MKRRTLPWVAAAAIGGLVAAGAALAQAAAGTPVTGAEIEAWFAADQMAVAGVNMGNGCHWITKGPMAARVQTVYCPFAMPFTVTGEARVEGNRLCSKFTYPDGNRFDACQEIVKVGDHKYEGRVNGVARTVMYRLVR